IGQICAECSYAADSRACDSRQSYAMRGGLTPHFGHERQIARRRNAYVPISIRLIREFDDMERIAPATQFIEDGDIEHGRDSDGRLRKSAFVWASRDNLRFIVRHRRFPDHEMCFGTRCPDEAGEGRRLLLKALVILVKGI